MAGNILARFHVAGVILILLGAGGALLSLLWDVIYKGTAFSATAVGQHDHEFAQGRLFPDSLF